VWCFFGTSRDESEVRPQRVAPTSVLPATTSTATTKRRLPTRLRHRGSPGSDPESGDLIYFVPWGNLGFYYNAEGIGYSDDTIHLGTYDASLDQLKRLEGEVTVEVIN
jgi:hypothetical protein